MLLETEKENGKTEHGIGTTEEGAISYMVGRSY